MISVLIATLNAGQSIEGCLQSLAPHRDVFDEVIIIDSNSHDHTQSIAQQYNIPVISFQWNGEYPKKRQWILDHIESKNNWIFFLDADERVTEDFVQEIKQRVDLSPDIAGYFIEGQYVVNNQLLRHGLRNNKLALFDRHKIEFPVVDDLHIPDMGEIEGHYQPVIKSADAMQRIGCISAPILHHAYDDRGAWHERHDRYARWEAHMIKGNLYPVDPIKWREYLKRLFRALPMRGAIMFFYCYIIKGGFLDGKAGFVFAKSRYDYYQRVACFLKRSGA